MNRVLGVFLTNIGVWGDPALVDRETTQIKPVYKGSLFDFLERSVAFVGHLSMQNFDSIESPFSS